MGRVAMVESESRHSPPPAVKPAPEPAALAAAALELAHCLVVTTNVLRRLAPSPVADELSDLVSRRVARVRELLGAED